MADELDRRERGINIMAKPGKNGSESQQPQGASAGVTVLSCPYKACKSKPQQFGFCGEHFQQFKFGLINKKGEHVPDYEKKFGHYSDFVAKKSAKKAA